MKILNGFISFVKNLPRNIRGFFVDWLWQVSTFTGLLLIYLFNAMCAGIISFRFSPPPLKMLCRLFLKFTSKLLSILTPYKEDTINRISLIDLAIKNMKFKKSRAMITVGGMALGIGAIVFLVSLGYGVNRLVIDRVARLEEMMQADVLPQPGSQIEINDEKLSQFLDLPHVEKALPMIAVVAKVNFQNSVTDMAVYGVTTDYLRQSAIQPIYGKLFESDELAVKATGGVVAGVNTIAYEDTSLEDEFIEEGELDQHVEYTIHGGAWLRVRNEPSTTGEILGYTRRVEGVQTGKLVDGEEYNIPSEEGASLSSEWVESSVKLWEKTPCTEAPCEDGNYVPILDESGNHTTETGYIAQIEMSVSQVKKSRSQVLGVATISEDESNLDLDLILGITDEASDATDLASTSIESSTASASTNDGIVEDGDWVIIASESAQASTEEVKSVALGQQAKKEAVVNSSMLQVLGIQEAEAVGKTFEASFIVVGDLLNDETKVESVPTNYTIVGVIPDDSAPFFYVPFVDLRSLGVKNYSQVKVIVDNRDELAGVRRQIEALGFATSSVADTVEQIDALFATIRSVLALLGMVALAVASLGMFNTLTVSLLERTREVGLMKAMGMKSHEVRELFLTESMIMGFFGGLSGIALGFTAGKLLSFALSTLSLVQNQGFIDVSYIPSMFVIVVFLLSLIVGIFTGIYPARRATKISALNALRYE